MREQWLQLFAEGVSTNLGMLHEAGHREPWIIAMDCRPTRAAVLDYGARWAIEPTFSDFKSRGFNLDDSQLHHADRCERLILIMTLAMYGCVRIGRDEALQRPTPREKKLTPNPTPTIGVLENTLVVQCRGSSADCVA
jgi:hypothetical protein